MATIIQTEQMKIFPSDTDLFQFAADDFKQRAINAVTAKGNFSVVLSGGNTPKALFNVLATTTNIPWEQIQFFFGDERYVPADSTESNYHMAQENLFSKVAINPKNIYKIPTDLPNADEAAAQYEKILRQVLPTPAGITLFDLIYLGLGDNAHTASLMPATDLVKYYATDPSAAHDTRLVAALYVPALKMFRITLTPPAINNAGSIIFLVTGSSKAEAVKSVFGKNYDPIQYPAQLIHLNDRKTIWYLDAAAAKNINATSATAKAIFLDSDGVLNTAIIKEGKPVAPTSLAELVIPNEVKPALEKLKAAGYLLICVTNKPDIERGLMTQEEVDAIYNKIRAELPLDDVCFCYHENSDCYKPKPGLLLAAAKKYSLNLAQCFMIGDRWRDIGAGQNAGCKTIWINRGYQEQAPSPPADYTVFSLAEAAEKILTS